MKIKIITNSFNRDISLVERSLSHSLALSDHIEEVIFIDQNETPLQLNTEIKNHPCLRHISHKVKCVSTARNKILESLAMDSNLWLIFCDDDGYIDSEYINIFKNIHKQHPETMVLAGSIIRDDNNDYYSIRHKLGGSLKNFRHTKLLMGSNFICHSSVFIQLNGFDENFGAGSVFGSGEELDFTWKCYFSGVSMEFFPELKVFHIKPYAGTFEDSVKKAKRYGIGKGALVNKWLLQEKKVIVIIELIEMVIIPIGQTLKSLITFKFKESKIFLNVLYGRILGLFKFNAFNK